MIVEVAEVGSRPVLWTKARLNAPHGVRKLGELFSEQNWADKAIVVLDWQPEELADSEHKHDAIVRVFIYKRVRELGRRIDLNLNLDVNDLFSKDVITASELGWVTDEFKKKLDYELQRVGAHH